MKYLIQLLIPLSLFFLQSIKGQNTVQLKARGNFFADEYFALKNDTSIKHGWFTKKYKDYIIEHGQYFNNEKKGKWLYFSLDGEFEFQYDYDLNKITKISQFHTPEDYLNTPVYYLGSPIVPYIFLTSNISYPKEAKEFNINGKVILAISINNKGKITSLRLAKKLHHLIDKEVMNAAKMIPNSWKWIPATRNGEKINSEYQIEIEFELVDSIGK